jgi:tetratricopeptide (TPR) repeat protein
MKLMNKVVLAILLSFSINLIVARDIKDLLIGSWIKTNIEYGDGTKLSIENSVNMQYLRFTFRDYKTLFKAISYDNLGGKFEYTLLNNNVIKAELVLYQIEKITNDTLILKEITTSGTQGFRYFFEKESVYQSRIKLDKSMFFSFNSDTFYFESIKFRPEYLGDLPFNYVLSQKLTKYRIENIEEAFIATMIINEFGKLDSINIQKGINSRYDKKAFEIIKQNSSKWKPAYYNGKAIKTMKILKIQYGDPSTAIIYHSTYFEGLKLELSNDYLGAIDAYSKCIELNPKDPDAYYHRGLCKIKVNKYEEACTDFNFVVTVKKYDINDLINKYCSK